MFEMINFLVAIAIFAACIFVTWVIYAIVNAIWEHKTLKKRLEQPKFYGWIAELNDMVGEEVRYHNKEIAPLKREIDKLIAEQSYYAADKRLLMAGVLEEYRQTLADREYELKRMKFESAKLRNRIREYNKEHELEKGWDD
jgi:hypothetical protein